MRGIPPPCSAAQPAQIDDMHQSSKPHPNDKTPTPAALVPLIPGLMRRARRLSGSRSEAEDIVQDTLLRLCQRLRDGSQIDDLPAYAMRTLTNGARRTWKTRPTEELEDDMATTEPEAHIRLDCADTLAAIAALPEPQRALMAYLIEGETSPASIAARTGLPLGTVMSRLARARARLRLSLKAS